VTLQQNIYYIYMNHMYSQAGKFNLGLNLEKGCISSRNVLDATVLPILYKSNLITLTHLVLKVCI
jgi:hypothetical protein